MPGWLAYPQGVVLDIVRDVRAAFGDHHAEDAGADGHALETLVKLRIRRGEPFDRDDVDVDAILVEQIDKTHLNNVSARHAVTARS